MNAAPSPPPRVHVVGRRNHGKTTLVVDLVRALTARGLRVATLKHSSHRHELDTPGKDSHLHRTAGAARAAIVTPTLAAVYLPRAEGEDPDALLLPLLAGCDLLVVEGHLDGPGPKIEVWRARMATPPLASERADIAAVVTDDEPEALSVPVWPRSDVPALACRVLALARAAAGG